MLVQYYIIIKYQGPLPRGLAMLGLIKIGVMLSPLLVSNLTGLSIFFIRPELELPNTELEQHMPNAELEQHMSNTEFLPKTLLLVFCTLTRTLCRWFKLRRKRILDPC